MSDSHDRALGMDRPITRRDFMNGAAMVVGAAMLPRTPAFGAASDAEPQNQPGYNPPTKSGLRGSHAGSFDAAHSLRDGTFWDSAGPAVDTGEVYDLVIAGAGISGLSAAYFFREKFGKSARILMLENHDDFGGHAKRNEFHLGGRLQLMNGGTFLIDSPTPYSSQADGLIRRLGIDPPKFQKEYSNSGLYRSLGLLGGTFFDKETFGVDRLVVGGPGRRGGEEGGDERSWSAYLAKTPLSPDAQKDIVRLQTARIDYLPGLSSAEKKDRLSRMSYRDFLLNVVKVHPDVVPYYQNWTHGEWGVGIDAEPALDCWAQGTPGFQGMKLDPGAAPRMSYTAAGYLSGGSYRYHFPDGNASIARLLVRSLVPGAIPGHSAEDVVTAQADYSRLDRSENTVRIRLNSTVVRARNAGDPANAKEVEVAYSSGGRVSTVRAGGCVLACWNMMIPFLCPELPEKQKEALHYLVKVPLIYTSVGLRNWTAFKKLGVQSVSFPGGYWENASLNSADHIGDYKSPTSPEEPILLRLSKTPCKPGLPAREQHKAGRAQIYVTPFETYERNLRDQLARALGGGGFDPARDIEAITVNRWPHGYGYEYNPLFDPDWPEEERPNVIGRKRFGRITIANTDAAATAYTDAAIDQAYRAVGELLA